MSRLLILGATGNLGRVLVQQAVARGHKVSVVVRDPAKLPPAIAEQIEVHRGDLAELTSEDLARWITGHDALINAAGNVADGEGFTALVDRIIEAAESVAHPPVCWFMAGAALLDMDDTGLKGFELPLIPKHYQLHGRNFDRLSHSGLDWRLCCPGPMVGEPAVGLGSMRVSIDRFPVEPPVWTRHAPRIFVVPHFIKSVGQITVPYTDVADLILSNLSPDGPFSRKRIGIALPKGLDKVQTPLKVSAPLC